MQAKKLTAAESNSVDGERNQTSRRSQAHRASKCVPTRYYATSLGYRLIRRGIMARALLTLGGSVKCCIPKKATPAQCAVAAEHVVHFLRVQTGRRNVAASVASTLRTRCHRIRTRCHRSCDPEIEHAGAARRIQTERMSARRSWSDVNHADAAPQYISVIPPVAIYSPEGSAVPPAGSIATQLSSS